MKLNYLITFLLLLIVIPLVSSVPPVTTLTNQERGIDIIHPETPFVKLNQDLEINFWTYNSTSGATITNESTNCTLYIIDDTGNNFWRFSNQAGANGLITYGKGAPLCVNCWTMTMPSENLSLGLYSYQIKCQGLGMGGYQTGFFEVTKFGKIFESWDTEIAKTSIYFLFLLSITFIFLGYLLTNKESIWAKNVGLLLILIGFIFIYYDLVMINTYSETIVLSTSANLGVFKIFIKFIKLMPYIIALISIFALVKFLREVVNNKKSKDGWDNNNY